MCFQGYEYGEYPYEYGERSHSETQGIEGVARGWQLGNGELLFKGFRVSVWEDGKALEMDDSDCTI